MPTSTLDCFAAFHRYVSQVRRRLRKDGQGEALPAPGRRITGRAKPCPVPAHCAGTVDGVTSAHGAGNHPAATRHPSQEGNLRVRAGLKPAPTNWFSTTPPLTIGADCAILKPQPSSKPTSLIFDI
ncbi:MAG: hypothetical protein LBM98_10135 [Oscillospiraceae bacterium]|nr:hypothetical protein [Oscillospiraceae bacterium]